jgi:hypothetical protein
MPMMTCNVVGITARSRKPALLSAGLVRTYCSTTSVPLPTDGGGHAHASGHANRKPLLSHARREDRRYATHVARCISELAFGGARCLAVSYPDRGLLGQQITHRAYPSAKHAVFPDN